MTLSDRPAESLDSSDIQSLIEAAVPEGRDIEYKRDLPSKSDADKKEYLADVSSFANAAGGWLIYGIEERDGIPVAAPGIPNTELDSEILRLENLARDGIEERIPGIRIQAVPVSGTHSVVALRIPRSWAGPHLVAFRGSSRFFARNSRGKYQMDLRELRRAFDQASATRDQVRKFRLERVAAIVAGETPVRLYNGPKVMLHVVPLSAMAGRPSLDIASVDPEEIRLTALRSGRYDLTRYNFDGLVVSPPAGDDGIAPSYAQLFRTGAIETVSSTMIYPDDGRHYIKSLVVESALIETVSDYVGVASRLELEPPFVIMLTFSGIEGYQVLPETRNRHWDSFRNPLDRDILLIPEVVVETTDFDAAAILRPAFDTLWQSAGWPRSLNYENDGTHRPTAGSG